MSNCHTRIIESLLTGPKTSKELREVGGESYNTRIYELRSMYTDIDIVYSRVTRKFSLVLKRPIMIDQKRVYKSRLMAA